MKDRTTEETVRVLAAALIEQLRTDMPQLQDEDAFTAPGPNGIGPEKSVPAIHLHLLFQHIANLEVSLAAAQTASGEPVTPQPPAGEFGRARALRACATSIMDNVPVDFAADTRARLIIATVARLNMLPLVPVMP